MPSRAAESDGKGGRVCTSVVHVDDAARLFLLAAERAEAGEVFNGISDTTITFAEMANTIAALLNLPVHTPIVEEASAQVGPFIANFLTSPCRGSSAKAKQVLGWQPREIGLIEDIKTGSYTAVAAELKKAKFS